jgi:hypothetical protein
VSLDGDIACGELPLIDVEEFEILLEHEDVFGAVAAEGCCPRREGQGQGKDRPGDE